MNQNLEDSSEKLDWKISADLIFQHSSSQESHDDIDVFAEFEEIAIEVSPESESFYVEFEDPFNSGTDEIDGVFWDFSEVNLQVVFLIENCTWQEAKKAFFQMLKDVEFVFDNPNSDYIESEFHRINTINFYSMDGEEEDLVIELVGSELDDQGNKCELNSGIWELGESGKLAWRKLAQV